MMHRSLRRTTTALLLSAVVLGSATGCDGLSRTTAGEAVAPDTGKVAGLEVTHFESGVKPDAPKPDIQVENATDGPVDKVAIATIADVSLYWTEVLPDAFGMQFQQLKRLVSYDSSTDHVQLCGSDIHGEINAFYCPPDDAVAWDRGVLLPNLVKLYGDVAPITVLAHEYGHAVQHRLGDKAGITAQTKSIVAELQADCFTGSYLRWVAEGRSKYLRISTAEGLNAALSSLYLVRDSAGRLQGEQGAHGTSFDRTFAFQEGFETGAKTCAGYNAEMLKQRSTQFPFSDEDRKTGGDSAIDQEHLEFIKQSLDRVFAGKGAPQLSTSGGSCGDGGTPPASYCPDNNTLAVDLSALAQIGAPIDREGELSGKPSATKGDFAAWASVASRYTLAVQKANGEPIDSPMAALRTACLTGAWARGVQNPKDDGPVIRLSPGDLDEAILEMLQPKSLIGSNVKGDQVPSGFLRIEAFRTGYLDGTGSCSSRYK